MFSISHHKNKNISIFSRLLREGLPALLRPDRQDGGRELQPHDVRGLRRRVLLALHEGDLGPALPQSVGVHILGEEAMVREGFVVFLRGKVHSKQFADAIRV